MLLAQGDVAGAEQWADSELGDADDEQLASFERLAEALSLARVRIARGEPATAAGLVARLVAAAEAAGRQGSLPELLAVLAVALDRSGERAQALTILAQALRLAEPEGYVRAFVDEGEAMAGLLRQMLTRQVSIPYVKRLLDAFDRPHQGLDISAERAHLLPERPTERELEVLRLLADGLSNRQIGEQLVIAESTVKAHLHHLSGKLGVVSRTQVLARARELDLL